MDRTTSSRSIKLCAVVFGRSDGKKPNSEACICANNIHRRRRLLAATRWDDLYNGSLNLWVAQDDEDGLAAVREIEAAEPAVVEPWDQDWVPTGYKDQVARERQGWQYWKATVFGGSANREVLVRRPGKVPPDHDRLLEAYAPVRLRDALNVDNGDRVEIEVNL